VIVRIQLGRVFAREAGFAERDVSLPEASAADALLREVARLAPALSCVDEAAGAVDLGAANLSVNGAAVDPRSPEKTTLHDGDRCYLFGVIAGG
jgi:molybdopterin converting factor small subunit